MFLRVRLCRWTLAVGEEGWEDFSHDASRKVNTVMRFIHSSPCTLVPHPSTHSQSNRLFNIHNLAVFHSLCVTSLYTFIMHSRPFILSPTPTLYTPSSYTTFLPSLSSLHSLSIHSLVSRSQSILSVIRYSLMRPCVSDQNKRQEEFGQPMSRAIARE